MKLRRKKEVIQKQLMNFQKEKQELNSCIKTLSTDKADLETSMRNLQTEMDCKLESTVQKLQVENREIKIQLNRQTKISEDRKVESTVFKLEKEIRQIKVELNTEKEISQYQKVVKCALWEELKKSKLSLKNMTDEYENEIKDLQQKLEKEKSKSKSRKPQSTLEIELSEQIVNLQNDMQQQKLQFES